MNLFHKKTVSHFEKEEKLVELDQYRVISDSDSEETTHAGNGIQGKDLYHPNPALFRRLIEGTSLDRRKNVEIEQKMTKTEKEHTDIIFPKNSVKFEKTTILKRKEKKEGSDTSGKKKKFINKIRKNRLGHVVHEVLGYPEKQNHPNSD